MYEFPIATRINKAVPKEKFYQMFDLTTAQKNKFVSDIDKIILANTFKYETIRIPSGKIEDIILVKLMLKAKECDSIVLEGIAKGSQVSIVFSLEFADEYQLAVYYKGKLYRTEWQSADEVKLDLIGRDIDELWQSFVVQIALINETAKNTSALTLDERLALEIKIKALQKAQAKTARALKNEKQNKKCYELYNELKRIEKELDELINNATKEG